ncbi:uncharacterized protein LOC135385771 [Ornithodoros turicata]|uniref:uncharacterized protein LOC135385771 n=1 Tax=Ornithodoros turicata TaxID=34597 RepID=UPI003139FD86
MRTLKKLLGRVPNTQDRDRLGDQLISPHEAAHTERSAYHDPDGDDAYVLNTDREPALCVPEDRLPSRLRPGSLDQGTTDRDKLPRGNGGQVSPTGTLYKDMVPTESRLEKKGTSAISRKESKNGTCYDRLKQRKGRPSKDSRQSVHNENWIGRPKREQKHLSEWKESAVGDTSIVSRKCIQNRRHHRVKVNTLSKQPHEQQLTYLSFNDEGRSAAGDRRAATSKDKKLREYSNDWRDLEKIMQRIPRPRKEVRAQSWGRPFIKPAELSPQKWLSTTQRSTYALMQITDTGRQLHAAVASMQPRMDPDPRKPTTTGRTKCDVCRCTKCCGECCKKAVQLRLYQDLQATVDTGADDVKTMIKCYDDIAAATETAPRTTFLTRSPEGTHVFTGPPVPPEAPQAFPEQLIRMSDIERLTVPVIHSTLKETPLPVVAPVSMNTAVVSPDITYDEASAAPSSVRLFQWQTLGQTTPVERTLSYPELSTKAYSTCVFSWSTPVARQTRSHPVLPEKVKQISWSTAQLRLEAAALDKQFSFYVRASPTYTLINEPYLPSRRPTAATRARLNHISKREPISEHTRRFTTIPSIHKVRPCHQRGDHPQSIGTQPKVHAPAKTPSGFSAPGTMYQLGQRMGRNRTLQALSGTSTLQSEPSPPQTVASTSQGKNSAPHEAKRVAITTPESQQESFEHSTESEDIGGRSSCFPSVCRKLTSSSCCAKKTGRNQLVPNGKKVAKAKPTSDKTSTGRQERLSLDERELEMLYDRDRKAGQPSRKSIAMEISALLAESEKFNEEYDTRRDIEESGDSSRTSSTQSTSSTAPKYPNKRKVDKKQSRQGTYPRGADEQKHKTKKMDLKMQDKKRKKSKSKSGRTRSSDTNPSVRARRQRETTLANSGKPTGSSYPRTTNYRTAPRSYSKQVEGSLEQRPLSVPTASKKRKGMPSPERSRAFISRKTAADFVGADFSAPRGYEYPRQSYPRDVYDQEEYENEYLEEQTAQASSTSDERYALSPVYPPPLNGEWYVDPASPWSEREQYSDRTAEGSTAVSPLYRPPCLTPSPADMRDMGYSFADGFVATPSHEFSWTTLDEYERCTTTRRKKSSVLRDFAWSKDHTYSFAPASPSPEWISLAPGEEYFDSPYTEERTPALCRLKKCMQIPHMEYKTPIIPSPRSLSLPPRPAERDTEIPTRRFLPRRTSSMAILPAVNDRFVPQLRRTQSVGNTSASSMEEMLAMPPVVKLSWVPRGRQELATENRPRRARLLVAQDGDDTEDRLMNEFVEEYQPLQNYPPTRFGPQTQNVSLMQGYLPVQSTASMQGYLPRYRYPPFCGYAPTQGSVPMYGYSQVPNYHPMKSQSSVRPASTQSNAVEEIQQEGEDTQGYQENEIEDDSHDQTFTQGAFPKDELMEPVVADLDDTTVSQQVPDSGQAFYTADTFEPPEPLESRTRSVASDMRDALPFYSEDAFSASEPSHSLVASVARDARDVTVSTTLLHSSIEGDDAVAEETRLLRSSLDTNDLEGIHPVESTPSVSQGSTASVESKQIIPVIESTVPQEPPAVAIATEHKSLSPILPPILPPIVLPILPPPEVDISPETGAPEAAPVAKPVEEEKLIPPSDSESEAEKAIQDYAESTIHLYPESRLVLVGALICIAWILFTLLFTTSSHREGAERTTPKLSTEPTASVTEESIQTPSASSLSTANAYTNATGSASGVGTPSTPQMSTPQMSTPTPPSATTGIFYCSTEFCRQEGLYLESLLQTSRSSPCDNFYDYVCDGWVNSVAGAIPLGSGTAISRDTELQSQIEEAALSYIIDGQHADVAPARQLYEACKDRTRAGAAAVNSARQMFRTWKINEWPLTDQSRTSKVDDVWRFAGEISRDLNIDALLCVSVAKDPRHLNQLIVDLGQPRPIYFPGDSSYIEVSTLFREAIKETAAEFLADTTAQDVVVNEVMITFTTIVQKFGLGTDRTEPGQDMEMSQVHDLSAGVQHFLSTVFVNVNTFGLNNSLLLHHPTYVRLGVDEAVNALPPRTTLNYLGFRCLLRLAPFLPEKLTRLRELYSVEVLGRTQEPNVTTLCLRAIEIVLPVCFVRSYAVRRVKSREDTGARNWLSQLESIFISYVRQVEWMDDLTALLVRYKMKHHFLARFFPYWAVQESDSCTSAHFDSTQTPLIGYFETSVRRRNEMLQKAFGNNVQTRFSMGWLLDIVAKYQESQQTFYIPQALLNASVPTKGTIFAFHLSRVAVRLYVALIKILYGGTIYEKETPLHFTDDALLKLDEVVTCFERDFDANRGQQNINASWIRYSLMEQGLAVHLAFLAFQKLVHVRRIWHLDFRLITLQSVTSDQLFFIYYALDNCEYADAAYRHHEFFQHRRVPPQQRVNLPLRHLPQFALAFNCTQHDFMVAPAFSRCATLKTQSPSPIIPPRIIH